MSKVKEFKMFINNEWVNSSSGEIIEVKNPATGQVIATVPKGNLEDVDKAMKAAAKAKETFKLSPITERIELCQRIADELEKEKEEIAKWMTWEQGKPYSTESLPEVEESILNFRNAAEDIKHIDGNIIYSNDPNKKIFSVYEPCGTYAAITPWNFPLVIPVEYVGPGLVAGNTMVLKPASYTPISVILMTECIERAGVPKGIFNVVTGSGDVVGEGLVTHPDTDAIGFTGENITGKKISSVAGLRRMLLEMGGDGPQIVCDDANVVEAAKEACYGAYMNAGQVCCATERVLCHESIKDEFVEEVLKITSDIKLGDPMDATVTMGPLNNEPTAQKVDRHIKDALEKGAKVLCGGKRASGFPTDLYYEPTVLDDVVPGMIIHDEETFGPVIPITTFKTDDEAIEIANSIKFGLQMAVFTSSLKKANYYSRRLRTGNLGINASTCYWEAHQPFGGCPGTDSGYGRLGGKYTIYDMMYIKTFTVDFEKCK